MESVEICDRLRDVPGKDIFKLSCSTAASEFCELDQIGIDMYVSMYLSIYLSIYIYIYYIIYIIYYYNIILLYIVLLYIILFRL